MTYTKSSPRTGIKVVVHAGPTLFQEMLTQALAVRGHVVQATTGDDVLLAAALIRRLGPDVCIVDAVEKSPWLDGALRLRQHAPAVKIVVMSTGPSLRLERAYDNRLVDAVVERGCAFDQLHAVLMRTVRGGRCMAEAHEVASFETDPAPVLTIREQQVLDRLVRGATTYSIAQELRISPHTVRTHVGGLMRKLGVHARGKAVSVAVARDLLEARSA